MMITETKIKDNMLKLLVSCIQRRKPAYVVLGR